MLRNLLKSGYGHPSLKSPWTRAYVYYMRLCLELTPAWEIISRANPHIVKDRAAYVAEGGVRPAYVAWTVHLLSVTTLSTEMAANETLGEAAIGLKVGFEDCGQV